ncbi:DMT family transporter (plasmid) [Pseudomonas luteola]|uniref:DMT family transporter n=1 Tax=Pseudomonas luteola TaxID=47886 RepID=UPI003890D740
MLISGTVGWFVMMAGQSPETTVFWRCAFGSSTLLLICFCLGLLRLGMLTLRLICMAATGGVALVLNWLFLFGAYSYSSIAVATIVYHTQPFMLVGIGALFFKERISLTQLLWLTLAFTGVAAIAVGEQDGVEGGSGSLLDIALSLASAFFYAVAAAITKKLKVIPAPVIALIQLGVGTLLLWPYAALNHGTPTTWGLLVTVGMDHTALMSILLYGTIQKVQTHLVGTLSFIYPLVAVLVDWLALGHSLSVLQLGGAVLVLLAAAAMSFGWKFRAGKGALLVSKISAQASSNNDKA